MFDDITSHKKLLMGYAGKSFDNGLLHIHSIDESAKWTKLIHGYFPGHADQMVSFGHDWMGRVYCVDAEIGGGVRLFDPAVLEEHYFEGDLQGFLTGIFDKSKVEFLSAGEFDRVLKELDVKALKADQCVGYIKPLFLNGNDDISNVDVSDMEVYWEINHQLYQQVRDLREGTRIDNVTLLPGHRSSAEGSSMLLALCNFILLLVIVLRTYNVYFTDGGNDKNILVPASYLGGLVLLNLVVLLVLYYKKKTDAANFQQKNLIFIIVASVIIIGIFSIF